MSEAFEDIKLGAQAIAENIAEKRAELSAKRIILTDRPEETAAYLPVYHHTMNELIEIGPWQSYAAFRDGAGRSMPRLLLTDKARLACREDLAQLTDTQRRASYLFSYEDAADWIHENFETEVMSVVVPLSMFATDPEAFRAEFLDERRERYSPIDEVTGRGAPKIPLARWRVVRTLPKDVQSEIGRWQIDYNTERERQNKDWPHPQGLKVTMPEGIFARYKDLKQVAPTVVRARNTVYYEGYAVHREVDHTKPYCRRHYTPGLLLGKPVNWKDYEIGLVDVMSIPRACALLGKDYLQKSPWRLGRDDVAWCRDESVLHDVKLSQEYRILLRLQSGGVKMVKE